MSHRPHKHLILDGFVANPPKDEAEAKVLLENIIKEIDMKVAELSNNQPNPIAWYCDDPDNRGLTASAILTTSHCVMHVWDAVEPAPFHFDLYSCSDFDPKYIIKRLHDEYGFIDVTSKVLDRNNPE